MGKIQFYWREIDPSVQKCPNCGNEISKADYYTGMFTRKVDSYSTREIFIGAEKHTGGLCWDCEKKKIRKSTMVFPIISIVLFVLAICGAFLQRSPVRQTAELGEILFTICGIFFLGALFCDIVLLALKPKGYETSESLSKKLILLLEKEDKVDYAIEHYQSLNGLVPKYMSPEEVSEMKTVNGIDPTKLTQ